MWKFLLVMRKSSLFFAVMYKHARFCKALRVYSFKALGGLKALRLQGLKALRPQGFKLSRLQGFEALRLQGLSWAGSLGGRPALGDMLCQ